MSEISAVPVSGLEGVDVSADGQHALFKFKSPDPAGFNLAVPVSSLSDLLSLASTASGQAHRILQGDKAIKHVLPVEWWEVVQTPDRQHVVMSFRLPGGAELSFQIHRDAAAHFQDVLASILGTQQSPSPETPRH